MTILFTDFDTPNFDQHTVESLAECRTETERQLWTMHEQHRSQCWKLGRVTADRLDTRLITRNPARDAYRTGHA